MFVVLLASFVLRSSLALLADYSAYTNESISFYVPADESGDARRLSALSPMKVTRRGAPVDQGSERMIAYVNPLGVELELHQARDLFSSEYKEIVVDEDGSTNVVRDTPSPCMYVTCARNSLSTLCC